MKKLLFRKRSTVYGFTALIAITFVGIFCALSWDNIRQDFPLAISRQPENLTELFFDNSERIPSSAKAGQHVSITFKINNLEAKDMSYRYKTSVKSDNTENLLNESKIDIKDGQSKSITQDFVAPLATGRAEFVVLLVEKNQSIHFWVDIH